MKFFWIPVIYLLFANGVESNSYDLDVVQPYTIGGKLQQIIGEIVNLPGNFLKAAINAFNVFVLALDDTGDKELWQQTSKTILDDVSAAVSESLELLPKIQSIAEDTSFCISNTVASIKTAVSHIKEILPSLLKVLLGSLLDTLKFVFETLIGSLQLVSKFKRCSSIYCKTTSVVDIFTFAKKQISALVKKTKTFIENITSTFKATIGKVVNGVTESVEQLRMCIVEENAYQFQATQTSLALGSRSISTELKETMEAFLKIFIGLFETVINRINDLNNDLSLRGKEELAMFIQTVETDLKTLIGGFQKAPEKFKAVVDNIKTCFIWQGLDLLGLLGQYNKLIKCRSDLEKKTIKIKEKINNEIADYMNMHKECSNMEFEEVCRIGVATNIPAKVRTISEICIAGIPDINVFVKCFSTELTAFLQKLFKILKKVDECVK